MWEYFNRPMDLYREREGPEFWAEPVNALSNLAFIAAAIAGLLLALREKNHTLVVRIAICLAVAVGVGSFLFHTYANQLTQWFDLGQIFAYQCFFLYIYTRRFLKWPVDAAASVTAMFFVLVIVAVPIGMPYWNGSASYLPPLFMLAALSVHHFRTADRGRWLMPAAVVVFMLAMTFRSLDFVVASPLGTHYLWHLTNGLLFYLTLHALILRYR
jgi:hypothetical protein